MSKFSEACCTVPPVQSSGYKAKGKYITVDGMKTYATGSTESKKALLLIYDIFGFFDQTVQGADILAFSNERQNYQIFMPDFFEGRPADISWYPPDTPEKQEKLQSFFQTMATFPKTLERLPRVVQEIEKENPNIEAWGVVGFCWGGKIVSLSSGKHSLFKAGALVHPSTIDPKDATAVSIPLAILASQDEPADDMQSFKNRLQVDSILEWFPGQIHGFMSARSNLEDQIVRREYTRGYQILLDFFPAAL